MMPEVRSFGWILDKFSLGNESIDDLSEARLFLGLIQLAEYSVGCRVPIVFQGLSYTTKVDPLPHGERPSEQNQNRFGQDHETEQLAIRSVRKNERAFQGQYCLNEEMLELRSTVPTQHNCYFPQEMKQGN